MNSSAPTSGWPTRDRALLIADPSPAFLVGIEFISVLVSGATTSEIPRPNRVSAGSTSTRTDIGGSSVERSSSVASHGSDVGVIRANGSMPTAMISGLITRNGFGPIRLAAAPTLVDSTTSRMPLGKPVSAAAVAR